jgi:hypothetical protein
MEELLEASDLNVLKKDYNAHKRERLNAVIIGVLGTIGWALLLVLIGQG